MGICCSKPPPKTRSNIYAGKDESLQPPETNSHHPTPPAAKDSSFFPFFTPSPGSYPSKKSFAQFKGPFLPPSPAKHLKAVLLRRNSGGDGGTVKTSGDVTGAVLDKSFGFSKEFASRYEVGEVVGRGHFGHTCSAVAKKGQLKDQEVAVKIIPKSKITTSIAIEDIRTEVKVLRSLTGHPNLVKFYEAFEDADNVYIIMELCQGGELLERILARGGKYSEDQAKPVIVQILNAIASCHLQGVVHRDIKPENFLFTSKNENSELKAIDFGLSVFVKPDQKLKDIVGSAYYVAPEVLLRSYGMEADVWSAGIIAYILLCGCRPFWAQSESGIFREVLKANPSFDENPWPSLSSESKDFVKCLLHKDPRRRITAAQALCHPWLRNHNLVKLPLDMPIFRIMEAYMRSSPLRKAALRALSKTLTQEELFYLKEQFALLCPDGNGGLTLDNIKKVLMKNATDAMKESHVPDILASINVLQFRRMYFEEFCAAALSVHQMEALDNWEQYVHSAYEIFDNNGNRVIVIEELASELGVGPSVPVHTAVQEWIRHSDGKLSLCGYLRLLHGPSSRRQLRRSESL